MPSPALAEEYSGTPSTFISPDKSLGFSITVPDHNTDVLFTLRVKSSRSWGAVGLGSNDMPGALYLMIYQNESGDNVTFSPRLSTGNHEPRRYDKLEYEVLEGTGVKDGWMTLSARCTEGCRSWNSDNIHGKGYIDHTKPDQDCIYAVGPKETLRSNSASADIRYHEEHGVFKIDLKRTEDTSYTEAPVIKDDAESDGATLQNSKSKLFDAKSTMHAALMTLAILVLYPIGIAILRVGRWARWHGVNQGVALIVVLAAFGLGVATSFKYQRVSDLPLIAQRAGRDCFVN